MLTCRRRLAQSRRLGRCGLIEPRLADVWSTPACQPLPCASRSPLRAGGRSSPGPGRDAAVRLRAWPRPQATPRPGSRALSALDCSFPECVSHDAHATGKTSTLTCGSPPPSARDDGRRGQRPPILAARSRGRIRRTGDARARRAEASRQRAAKRRTAEIQRCATSASVTPLPIERARALFIPRAGGSAGRRARCRGCGRSARVRRRESWRCCRPSG